MYINIVVYNFRPHLIAVFFREDGSMKNEVFNLTIDEAKILVTKLQEKINSFSLKNE